ncbi:RNA-binding protein 7 [Phlebotomus papatasi]|uniref:RNA-binding protein 7 n=1 Tax=Phlebotomus papatasi TaxID=29031 RepID=UPI002483931A|nr:RNA-binding protein 7 [Phlebotomus papatasi]
MNDDQARTLFCGNLSDKVTEELLYELFLQAGPIDEVRIPKSRSFGFVTYRHEATIEYALNLYAGVRLFGRELKVSLKTQTQDRDQPANSLSQGPRPLGNPIGAHMMPQMPPPPQNPATMFGCVLDMQQLLNFGKQLNANFQGNLNASSSRGDYYGDNRSRDFVSRDKHYRNRNSNKPYGDQQRQRHLDKDRNHNPQHPSRSNYHGRRRR